MNRLLQSEQSDWTPRHVEGVEDRKCAYRSLRVEHLTDYCPGLLVARVADEYRLPAQVVRRRRLIDVAYARVVPVRVDEMVEELAPAPARGRDAEHPEVLIRPRKLARGD